MLIKNELETLNEKADAGAGEGDGFRGGGAAPGNVIPNKYEHWPGGGGAGGEDPGGDDGPAPKVGSKRGRGDDSDEEMEKENPRFRGDDSDED